MNNSSSSFLNLQWGSQTRSLLVLLLTAIHPALSLLLLVLSAMFVFFIRYYSGYKVVQLRAPLPPGPVPWPILGNIPELLLRDKPVYKWIENIMNQMNTDIGCIRLGATHVVPVRCPVIAREFLKTHDAVFASRPITMATEYSSRGFLTVAVVPLGDQWKKMRRVVASEVMSPARLQWLLGKRTEEADNLVRYVYNQCVQGDGVVNVRLATRAYSGNVIRKLMFNRRYFGKGRSDGGPGVEEEEHVEAIFTVLSLLYAFSVGDYMPFLRRLDLDGHRKKLTAAAKILNRYQDRIIDEKMKEWRDGENEFRVVNKEAEDLVDVLISLKDDKGRPLLSADEIKAQSAELMCASVDNPSNAVEWALAEIINQPDIIRKCVEEIEMAVGKDRLVLESDFSKLPYVKACAREAFRLHPIAPFNLPHVSNADTTVAGYFIPEGSHVLLDRAGLGQNPKVWDEPLKFKPERHLKDGSSDVELTEPELRFISFSTGRRGCVAGHLGSIMTIMLLARLVQGFEWTAPPGESSIDLSQSAHNMFLARPLHPLAKPRLPAHIYH